MQSYLSYRRRKESLIFKGSNHGLDMQVAIQTRSLEVLIFIIPLVKFFEIKMIGRLFATDVIILILFPLVIFSNYHYLKQKLPRYIIVFAFLWFFGQIVTDIVRDTPYVDYSRGWAKIAVTMVSFMTLYLLLYDSRKRLIIYAIGFAVGDILQFYISPGDYAEAYPWKFGVGPALTLIMILIATHYFRRLQILSIFSLGFISCVNLLLGFRSLAGVCFLSTVYMFFQRLMNTDYIGRKKYSTKKNAIIGLVVICSGFFFYQIYVYSASQGFLGEKIKLTHEMQSDGDFGLVVGARSEILASIHAIIDSPITGHGSWAKDYRYIDLLAYLRRSLGYQLEGSYGLGLIPTHSHIFGAWVEAGIFGALFWALILVLPIKVLLTLYQVKEPLAPLIAFISFLLIWDILFSPYGADRRFITTYYIVVLVNYLLWRLRDKQILN